MVVTVKVKKNSKSLSGDSLIVCLLTGLFPNVSSFDYKNKLVFPDTVSKGKLCEISSSLAVVWPCHLFHMPTNVFSCSSLSHMVLLREMLLICNNLNAGIRLPGLLFGVFSDIQRVV